MKTITLRMMSVKTLLLVITYVCNYSWLCDLFIVGVISHREPLPVTVSRFDVHSVERHPLK